MMRKLALVLMMLILSSTAQARDNYVREKVLYCVWPDGRIESFTEGGSYGSPIGLSGVWAVASIRQYPAAIRVNLEAPNRKKYIDFNNGWPCRIERDYTFTDHESLQPESDSFDPVD